MRHTGSPFFSQDWLKMGLIRSGMTELTAEDDDRLVSLLWPVTASICRTVIENDQSLIIEGCYIPPDWTYSFQKEYLKEIRTLWLVMTHDFIDRNFSSMLASADIAEKRIDDSYFTKDMAFRDNEKMMSFVKGFNLSHILIDTEYPSLNDVVSALGI